MKKTTVTINARTREGKTALFTAKGYQWEWEGFEFVIHRPLSGNELTSKRWTMTCAITGKRVSRGSFATRKDLIEMTLPRLDGFGVEAFKKLVVANTSDAVR
jgi:hypothetical protein